MGGDQGHVPERIILTILTDKGLTHFADTLSRHTSSKDRILHE